MTAPDTLKRLALIVTVVHAVASLISLATGETVRGAIAVAFVIAFFVGGALYLAAFFVALGRSRTEDVSLGGAFFLSDHAVDSADRRWFFGLALVQFVVAIGVSIAAPFTSVTFALLVPLLGLALAAMHGARNGDFPERA